MAIRILAAAVVFAAAIVSDAAPAGAGDPVHHQPPVDAPVVDPFRAPETRFGAGNRGLTYAPPSGTQIRASAPGEVVFAGPVAGTLHVTVLHADGLRTSYSFLDTVAVRRGQRVAAGEVVGAAGPGFHFGVRDGDAYLDPAALFGRVEVRVRLLPHEEPLPPTDAGLLRERIALTEVVRERGLLERAWSRAVEVGGQAIDAFEAGVHIARQSYGWRESVVEAGAAFLYSLGQDCTSGDAPLPASPGTGRVALLVGGYGSTSESAAVDDVDTGSLGYSAGDVLRYSYAGGRIPDADLDGPLASIAASSYGPEDTLGDLHAEGRQLADLVAATAEARPGAPVDLLAHSQGGLVTRLALLELERRGRLDLVGAVVTMGTPHEGADLATGSLVLGPGDHQSVALLADTAGLEIDPTAESVRQMAETSDLIGDLRAAGVPDGVAFRSIGATGDLVVTADKTYVDAEESAIVDLWGPTAHDQLPGAGDTTREIHLTLAGMAPRCRGITQRAVDAVAPEAISWAETTLIAGFSM